jgi:hypothetical protein
VTWYPGCTVDECHPMLPCEDCADKFTVGRMQAKGYLVIPPGDASPVAELVMAAVARERGWPWCAETPQTMTRETLTLLNAAGDVRNDPAVRAWVERGRE